MLIALMAGWNKHQQSCVDPHVRVLQKEIYLVDNGNWISVLHMMECRPLYYR